MRKSAAVIASKKFLEEVWTGDPPSTSRLVELLNELIVSYQDAKTMAGSYFELEPPREDWKAVYDKTCTRFPALGWYPSPDPAQDWETAPMTADAIDDIADITRDLREVVWYAENHSDEYAEQIFAESYFHWGAHAEELLGFLRYKQSC